MLIATGPLVVAPVAAGDTVAVSSFEHAARNKLAIIITISALTRPFFTCIAPFFHAFSITPILDRLPALREMNHPSQ
ncbi:hypothetical protein D3C71_1999450 [compost metagenome]